MQKSSALLIAHFVSFYFYSHCVSIPKKCTRRDKYIVTKESFSPVSELYTTVMSLVINSQELDNLSPHLSYLISFSAPFFFAKWPISNLIVSCTLFNLNLQLRVQLTCSLVVYLYKYILLPFPQLVFLKYISLVFLFLLLEIDIEMTISESSPAYIPNFGNIRMHFLIAHLRELITDHREK